MISNIMMAEKGGVAKTAAADERKIDFVNEMGHRLIDLTRFDEIKKPK